MTAGTTVLDDPAGPVPGILLVEDDEGHRQLALRAFSDHPARFRVRTARTLAEARVLIKQEAPDLIITDWFLPDGKGMEILPRSKNGEVTCPLIIMTSHGSEELAVEIMKSGAMDYFAKDPVFFARLPEHALRVLREWQNIRARIRAEADARSAERRLADIIAFLPDAVFAVDNAGTVIAWNEAIASLTGIPAPEMIGKGNHEYGIPLYGGRRPALIDMVLADHPEIGNLYDFIHRDGDRITAETSVARLPSGKGAHLWITARPLYDNTGARTGAIEVIRDITERKLAENALKESEERYRTILDQATDAILIHDVDGKIIESNRKAQEYLGYSADEMKSLTIADIDPASIRAGRAGLWEQVIAGKTFIFESSQARKDGSTYYVEISLGPIRLGNRSLVMGIIRDISERKRAEKERLEQEAMLETLLNVPLDTIALLDRDGNILRLNEKGASRFGKAVQDLIGKNVFNLLPPDLAHSRREKIESVFSTGEQVQFEDERDGKILVNTIYPVFAQDGSTVERIAIFASDITDRKRAEEALRQSEEQFRHVFDHSTAGKSLTSAPDGRLLRINQAFAGMLGYTVSELQGKNWAEITHPDDMAESQECMRSLLTGEKTDYRMQKRYLHRDGRTIWADVGTTMVRDGADNPLYLITTVVDITERKLAEEALIRSKEKIRSLFSSMSEGLVLHELLRDEAGTPYEYRILDMNPAAEKILGITADGAIGKLSRDAWQADQPPYLDMYANVALTGKPVQFETFFAPMDKYFSISVYSPGKGMFATVFTDITEQKQTRKALEESEKKYRTLFATMAPGVFYQDASGTLTDINPSALAMFGLSREEFIGRDSFHPGWNVSNEDGTPLPPEKHPSMIALRTGWPVIKAVVRVLRPVTQDFVWLEVTAIPAFHEGEPNPYQVFVTMDDITIRKKAEIALRESTEKFQQFFNSVNDAVYVHQIREDGTAGSILEANDLMCSRLGYTREELLGLPISAIIDSLGLPQMPEIAERIRRDGSARFETYHKRKDGSSIPVEVNTRTFLLGGERVALASARDITERKKAEADLRESEERLRLALEGAGAASWDWNIVTGNAVFSDQFYTMLGYEPGEFPADYAHWSALLHPDDQRDVLPRLHDQIRRKQALCEIEYRIRAKDGAWYWVLGRGKIAETGPEGQAVRLTGINIDITDRKLMESEIRSLNTVLEQRVQDRTEALTMANTELAKENLQRLGAEQQLRASVEEKTMLLKEVHHRVKNNLQIITSLLNLQSRYISDPETLAAIRESQNRVRAMALVHEKLYKSENISKIDLRDYIQFLGSSLFHFYGINPQRIRFTADIQGVEMEINSAIPLGLIINELISNSLKYAFPDNRAGEILVRIRREDESIMVLYRDTGIGIPQDLDWRNSQSLGLRLVTSLVEQLDGTIDLDRSSGTEFSIVIREKS